MRAISPAGEPQRQPITPALSTPGGVMRCFRAQRRESSLAPRAVCPSGRRGSRSGRSSTKACRGPLEGVINDIITAPLAVDRKMRFDAVAHGGSGYLRRQLADHVGAVGVAMPGGIEDQLFSFCLVLLPQRSRLCRSSAGVLPVVAAPQATATQLKVLQLLWSEAIGRQQLECEAPTGIRNGLHQLQDVLHLDRGGDRPSLRWRPSEWCKSPGPQPGGSDQPVSSDPA